MKKAIYVLTIGLISFQALSQTQVYSEDFQNGIPATFDIIDNDGLTVNATVSDFSDAWTLIADPNNPGDSIVGSTSYFDPVGQADRWLITPSITLGAFGNMLYWDAKSHDASFPDSYYVLASTTDTQLSSFTDTVYFNFAEQADQWNYRSTNLSEFGLDNETIHLAFVNRTNNGFKLYLDSISIEIEDPASVKENKIDFVKVFPNPAQDFVNIQGKFDDYSLYSAQGTIVLRNSSSNTIDLSILNSGVYFLEINKEGRVQRTRIIKN